MSGIKAPGDDGATNGIQGSEEEHLQEAPQQGETPPQNEAKEHEPETDEEIRAINDEIHELIMQASKAPDYSEALNRLEDCKNFEELFDAVNKEANELLGQEPAVQIVLEKIMQSAGRENFSQEQIQSLKTAVETNDFDNLKFPKRSREYGLTLGLTAIKNNIIRDLMTLALDKYAEKLGLTKAEVTVIKGYLQMISSMDRIYIRWRTELYPPELLKKLREMESKGEDTQEYLANQKLDDPYAVVRKKANGDYESVPYAIAFQQEYADLLKTLETTISYVEAYGPAAFGEHMDKDRVLTYLKAYKKALNLKRSKKMGKEWESVRLWKDVDRAWVKCQDRLQLVHGIESGYDKASDPSEVKIIPELKIVMQTTTKNSERLIKQMTTENSEIFPEWIKSKLGRKGRKAAETYAATGRSHVGIVTMINGGGNSMDFRGTAQLGPNYEDIQQEVGVKAFVDTKSQTKVHKDTINRKIFGAEEYDSKWVIKDPNMEDIYNAEFTSSHELGHVFMEDIGDFDEAKATWVGLVSMYERSKKGQVPRDVIVMAMREHVKCCMSYLESIGEDIDNYGKEGLANIRIFLKTGLLTKGANGKYEFHEDKVDAAYEEIGNVFAEVIELYIDPEIETEGSEAEARYNEYVESMTRMEGEYSSEIADLKRIASGTEVDKKPQKKKNPEGH